MRGMVLAVAAAIALALAGAPAAAKDYRFMTGPQGGSWYPLGGAISNFVRQAEGGPRVRVLPGGGITNVKAVEAGKADLGLGNVVSTIDAIAGRPPFAEPAVHLRHLATFYPQVFQIVVRVDSGVTTVADLAGKALAVGLRGHTGEQMARHVLQIYGLTYDDMAEVNHISYTDAVSLMKDGHIDCFMVVTTIPAGAVMDVAASRDIDVLALPEDKLAALRALNAQYVPRTIPAGTYPGQDTDIATFGTWTQLIAHADMPDDVAYTITRAVAENLDAMSAIVQAMDGIGLEQLAQDVGVPLHPGAARYYREVGAIE